MLEERFIKSTEFAELHRDNFETFSNGYALLIQVIGGELDVFDESSRLFTLKDWSSKAVAMSQMFAVIGDILEENEPVNRNFDVK